MVVKIPIRSITRNAEKIINIFGNFYSELYYYCKEKWTGENGLTAGFLNGVVKRSETET